MSNAKAKELLDAGADFVAGVAYLDRKEVGRWVNGEFYEEPGMEDVVKEAKAKKAHERQMVQENARLYAEAEKATEKAQKKAAKPKTAEVPEDPEPVSDADAATKMNSIPGSGPLNPVRVDGDNNRTPEVTGDTEPVSTEELLNALGNPEGAKAVKQGQKDAANTGTEAGPLKATK